MRSVSWRIEQREPLKAFISYAHEDRAYRDALDRHLGILKRANRLAIWTDCEVLGGERLHEAIDEALISSDLFLFLLSSHFVASQYCWEREARVALARSSVGEAIAIPIIVEPVHGWESSPFGCLKALPEDGKAISLWQNQDLAWQQVARSVSSRLGGLAGPPDARAFAMWTASLGPSVTEDIGVFARKLHADLVRVLRLSSQDDLIVFPHGSEEVRIIGDEVRLRALPETLRSLVAEDLRRHIRDVHEDFGAVLRFGVTESAEPKEAAEAQAASKELAANFDGPDGDVLLGRIEAPVEQPMQLGLHLLNAGSHKFSEEELAHLQDKLAAMFSAFVFVPLSEMHVDLHPMKDHGGVPDDLVGTEVGRNLLYQDLELKKCCAERLHPESELGKEFWEIYERSIVRPGLRNPSLRLCIEPGTQTVREGNEGPKFYGELKHMAFRLVAELENFPASDVRVAELNDFVLAKLVPSIEDDIRSSPRFRLLRQISSVATLALWYMGHLREVVEHHYLTKPVPIFRSPRYASTLQEIHDEYRRLYSQGAWTHKRRVFDPESGEVVYRTCVTGCIDFRRAGLIIERSWDGLDPLSWTPNEGRIPWQRWKKNRGNDARGGPSPRSSKRV